MYLKLKDRISVSVFQDETAHLYLRCLQNPVIIACGSERVKTSSFECLFKLLFFITLKV